VCTFFSSAKVGSSVGDYEILLGSSFPEYVFFSLVLFIIEFIVSDTTAMIFFLQIFPRLMIRPNTEFDLGKISGQFSFDL